jgi:hypothetical protein
VVLSVDYYSRTFHWVACCCTEITDDRVTFIEQWGLVATDGLDICGHFGSHRGLQFCWETRAIRVWNWNEWCRNMRLKWRLRAHQHLVILSHVFIAADMGLLPRLAHTQEGEVQTFRL